MLLISSTTSFNAFETLLTLEFSSNICNLIYLKELHILDMIDDLDLTATAVNLSNLERLQIYCTVEQFLPFLRYSKQSNIVLFSERYRQLDPEFALNLYKLNEARRMSGTPRKVKLGWFEHAYLATKWMAKNVNSDLVEISRLEPVLNQFSFMDFR